MNRILKQTLCLVLAALLLCAPIGVFAAQKEDLTPEQIAAAQVKAEKRQEMLDYLAAENYRDYRSDHQGMPVAADTIRVEAADYLPESTTAAVYTTEDWTDFLGNVEEGTSLVIGETGVVSWEVEVPADALYSVAFRYISLDAFGEGEDGEPLVKGYGTTAERGLKVDGLFPFRESRYLQFPRTWQDDYYIDENGKRGFQRDDSADSQLRPVKIETPLWQTEYAKDSTGYYLQEFNYFLSAGKHVLTLSEVQEPLMLRYIELTAPQSIQTYEEVLASYQANGYTAPSLEAGNYPKLDAEYPEFTSAQTVYATNDRTSAITDPQDPATWMLNTLGGEKWNTVGQWVEWKFEVPEDGLYYITPRSIQNVYDGVYSSRALYIDGEIPFYEAGFIQFTYSDEWKLGPLSLPDGTPMQFYLTAGEHTMRLNVVLGEMGEILAQAEKVMNTMNDYYLEILKLIGAFPDTYRDYEFSKLMPDVLQGMIDLAGDLYSIADQLSEINGYTGEKVVTLEEIALLLETLGGDEYKIAENFSTLNDKISTLGTWITDTRNQPLQLDYFLFTPASDDVVLPAAEASGWEGLVFEFRSFLVSFITDYNSMSQKEEDDTYADAVVVWMTTGRDQAQIIRSMVNDLFTSQTHIPINLKLVAGGQLQAVLAGVGPDVDLQEGEDGVITWAIRNANIPLQDLPGFKETTERFTVSAMVPLTLYGKTYALPYTQSFNVMFYRKDVLASLGIDPPDTWEDIYDIIPVLQNNNMSIAVPSGAADYVYQRYASDENFRVGNTEVPFGEATQYPNGTNDEYGIGYPYENGYKPGALVDGAVYVMPDGTMFNLTYGMQVNLDGANYLECFKQVCEFFTLYSFPRQYSFANRFRTGEMPMGIQGYGLYGSLMVMAPELRGLWAFSVLPGTTNVNDDGTTYVSRRTSSTIGAIQMLRGCGNDRNGSEKGYNHRLQAWEFMKFWCDAPAQERYGNELLALLGASGRHATANLEALKSQPWPAEDRKVLEECFEWVMTTYNMPGGYISARYVSFAFNRAYNDADAPIPALLEYIDQINAELTRKRREFDLPTTENYQEYDYEAYYLEHYKNETEDGGHIVHDMPME